MPRSSFSRDELVSALQVAQRILQAFPNAEYPIDGPPGMLHHLPIDGGTRDSVANSLPADGSPRTARGYGKGQLQPPRKTYTLASKIRVEKVDWRGLPRAARRIVELLAGSGPLTSHEIMARLEIARPTFSNATSKLIAKKLIARVALRGGSLSV